MSVLKRQREVRKQEKAALKREKREQRQVGEGEEVPDSDVATADELAGYGIGPEADEAGPGKEDA